MSDLIIALAGGATGAVATWVVGQASSARVAWAEVGLDDDEADERNAQLLVWVDDRTRALRNEMNRLTAEYAARGLLYSGAHGGGLAAAKAAALHEYRDEEWRARRDLARVRASERGWHWVWRRVRRRPAPVLTAATTVEAFLERWREPVTRHGASSAEAMPVLDRSRRTIADALAELPSLKLT